MTHAKNYKTVTKFVKVMPRILWPLFFLDTVYICATQTLFITKLGKSNNNDVIKVCHDNLRRSDECVMLQCEFDFAGDVFSGDIQDIVFKRTI